MKSNIIKTNGKEKIYVVIKNKMTNKNLQGNQVDIIYNF